MTGYLLIAVAAIPTVIVVWGVVHFLRRLTDKWIKLIAWSFVLAVVIGLVFFNALLLAVGLRNFHGKSVS